MKLLKIFSIIFILSPLIFSQTNQWVNFVAPSEVRCQAIEGQYLWVGTDHYLTKINTLTGEKEIIKVGQDFTSITSIAIDREGNKWIGVDSYGLLKYDGQTWTLFNNANSGLPSNYIQCITIDQQGNKWVGFSFTGLSIFREEGVILSVEKSVK
jgi:ligand-binding sensor domain-containing protein